MAFTIPILMIFIFQPSPPVCGNVSIFRPLSLPSVPTSFMNEPVGIEDKGRNPRDQAVFPRLTGVRITFSKKKIDMVYVS